MKKLIFSLAFFCLFVYGALAQSLGGGEHPLNGTWRMSSSGLFLKLKLARANSFDYTTIMPNGKTANGLIEVKDDAGNAIMHRQSGAKNDIVLKMYNDNKSLSVLREGNKKDDFTRVGNYDFDVSPFLTTQTPQSTYKSATITKITINSINPYSETGYAWDDALGYSKPDLTCRISQKNTVGDIWASPFRHDNLETKNCPVSWTVSDSKLVLFSFPTFDNYVFVGLYDYDSLSSEDYMAGFTFTLSEHLGSQKIDLLEKGCSITVHLSWQK